MPLTITKFASRRLFLFLKLLIEFDDFLTFSLVIVVLLLDILLVF